MIKRLQSNWMSLLKNTARPLKHYQSDTLERFTMMVVEERPSLDAIARWFEEEVNDLKDDSYFITWKGWYVDYMQIEVLL